MKDLINAWIAFSVISASFWLIVFLLGFLSLAVYNALKEAAGYWFLIFYKSALAVFFASVMVIPVILMREYGYSWWWYLFSFLFFYFSLSSSYAEDRSPSGNYSYLIGLISFPVFAIFRDLTLNPVTIGFFKAISWMLNSWIGVLIGIYVLFKIGSYILGASFMGFGLIVAGILGLKDKIKILFTGDKIFEAEKRASSNPKQPHTSDPTITDDDAVEDSINEITEEIGEKRTTIAELSEEIANLKNELATFEVEYNVRIGVLYIKLDELELGIKEYQKRIELLKTRKDRNLADIERIIEELYKDDYEKIKKEKDEASQHEKEYEAVKDKPTLDEQSEKRLKTLYRELAKKYHPDMARTGEEKEQFHKIMSEINDAYNNKDLNRMDELADELTEPEKTYFDESFEEELDRLMHESEKLDEIISNLEDELAELRLSDAYRFKMRADEAEEEGRDLFEEMKEGLQYKIKSKEDELARVKQEFKNLARSSV